MKPETQTENGEIAALRQRLRSAAIRSRGYLIGGYSLLLGGLTALLFSAPDAIGWILIFTGIMLRIMYYLNRNSLRSLRRLEENMRRNELRKMS